MKWHSGIIIVDVTNKFGSALTQAARPRLHPSRNNNRLLGWQVLSDQVFVALALVSGKPLTAYTGCSEHLEMENKTLANALCQVSTAYVKFKVSCFSSFSYTTESASAFMHIFRQSDSQRTARLTVIAEGLYRQVRQSQTIPALIMNGQLDLLSGSKSNCDVVEAGSGQQKTKYYHRHRSRLATTVIKVRTEGPMIVVRIDEIVT